MPFPWMQWCSPRRPFNAREMIDRVLESEGGISRDPHDRGNTGGFITNRGITRTALAAYRRCDLSDVSNADLETLTAGQAREIAYKLYYVRPKIDRLPERLRGAVTDFCFNSGQRNAIRALQRVVGATDDGVIGPETLRQCEAHPVEWTLDKYCNARIAFFEGIVRRDETQRRFLKGWTARAEKWRTG